ncbi:MAG TPA: hypothetical protein VJ464_14775 [Blastocatellia bacterium]|nr:hypothetical protein [Blastocatellia bacterium]
MKKPEQSQRQDKKQPNPNPSPLEALLPANVPGFERRSTTLLTHRELNTNEVFVAYGGPSGSTLLISIADLGNQPKLYKNFLTGGGLRQSPFGNSFGLPFRQASVQASPNYGLLLGQVSPAFPGQASGVVGMAQAFQTIQIPQASPQFSPQASPQVSAQLSAQFSPQFSPQSAVQSTATLLSQISQQLSPGRGPQSWMVISPGTPGDQPTVSTGPASLTPAQASDLLQRSGMNAAELSKGAQDHPFSLAQASSPADGSYIRPFGLDTGRNVAGWELYDGHNHVGTLILGVNDRIGILVEATNILSNTLLEIASKFNFGAAG